MSKSGGWKVALLRTNSLHQKILDHSQVTEIHIAERNFGSLRTKYRKKRI